MTEKLLQFLWQFQYFNRSHLLTTGGESLQVLHPGNSNPNQGPDFLNARIKIGNTTFFGSVELHLATSHWKQHRHDGDENYRNVILHVVYQHDLPETIADIPVLELEQRISFHLLQRYEQLMHTAGFIPCQDWIKAVPAIVWSSWKERLLVERLTRKAEAVLQVLEQTKGHWEEVLWRMLARNFGAKVNSDAFEAIAATLPVTLLAKHRQSIHQLEGLLLGQAGLLQQDYQDDYPKLLQREYRFLAKKYNLSPIHLPIHFLRMRPGNFPTIRLAQLAALIQQSEHLFSKILETDEPQELMSGWHVTANDYWHYHYLFDQPSSFKKKTLGQAMIENCMINTVATLIFAYGLYHKEEAYTRKALRWLEALPAEQNTIIKSFAALDVAAQTAFDSQALIELKNNYCNHKKCLQCAAGSAILKSGIQAGVS
jgi:hypothetical protein